MRLKNENPIVQKNNVNTDNILVSNKQYIGKRYFKYFSGYVNHSNDNKKTLPTQLPKSNGSIKN